MFLDDSPIIAGTLSLPRVGAWTASLTLDSDQPPSGSVQIELDGVEYRGTVIRSGEWSGRVRVLVVGGAGRLGSRIPARYYRGSPARIPLVDVLQAAGESLSQASDQDRLMTLLPSWTVRAGSASAALLALTDQLESTWRTLPDGTVWIGRDAWQPMQFEHEITDQDPAGGRVEIWSERLQLRPGVTFEGHRIGHVEHRIQPERIRTVFWTE